MTRKTWPLFLGSFVVPALLIAACSADTDDDDDGDNGGSGNSDTSGAGSTRNTTARTGSGNTNTGATTGRFGTSTNRSNSGGVLNRGGASAGGRSNQFNTAGAIAKAGNANAAGSAGKASGLAGMAGADSGSGGATSTTSTTSPANGGSATGGTTAVAAAGAAGAGAICPDGCASIGLTLAQSASADFAFQISPTATYATGSLTLTASLYAPGAQSGRVRLVIENTDGDDCTSDWTNLDELASGFETITANLTGCSVTQASLVGIRVRNSGTTGEKTYALYVNALTLASTTPPKNVTWTPASAAAISATAPDVGILGPVTAVTGATLTYLND